MALRRSGPATIVSFLVIGCGPQSEPEPDFIWQGTNLEIHGHGVEQDYFCAGTFEHIDAYMGKAKDLFGASGLHPTLSVGSSEYIEQYCPEGRFGCMSDYAPFALFTSLPLDHELAHVAQLHVTKCSPLITEGLAEYYSWRYRDRGVSRAHISEAIDATLAAGVVPSKYYALAGHFVGFLVETRGLAPLLELCDRTGWLPTHEQFEAAIEQVYDIPLASLISEYQTDYPACWQRDFSRKLVECDQDLAATIDYEQKVDLLFDVDCANEQTLGPRTSEGEPEQVWVNHRIRLAPGEYEHRIALTAVDEAGVPAPVNVSFLPCARCIDGGRGDSTFLYEGKTTIPHLRLAPGDYVVEVRVPLDEARPIRLTIDSH